MKGESASFQNMDESTQPSRWDILTQSDVGGEVDGAEQERKSVRELTQELFNGFMNDLPEGVDPVEYANSPDGYSGFIEYMSEKIDEGGTEQEYVESAKKFYSAMYEYSDDYMKRGGKIPGWLDDIVFHGSADNENEEGVVMALRAVDESYRDTIERMRENRLEQIPGEIGAMTESLQSQIRRYNSSSDLEPFREERDVPDASELFRKLETISSISEIVGDKLDMTSIIKTVHDRVLPELLPQFAESQNGEVCFRMLVDLTRCCPSAVKDEDGIAVKLAQFAVRREYMVPRENGEYHPDYLVDMMRDYAYKEEGNDPFGVDGELSEGFRDSVFFGFNDSRVFIEERYAGVRETIAEVIGHERYDAIDFVAQQINKHIKGNVPHFDKTMPILASAIVEADNPEQTKATCATVMDTVPNLDGMSVVLTLHKLSGHQDVSAQHAVKFANDTKRVFGDLMKHVGIDGKSSKKLERIGAIADSLLGYVHIKDDKVTDYFRECIESGRDFTEEESSFLRTAGQLDADKRPRFNEVLTRKIGTRICDRDLIQQNIAGLVKACVGIQSEHAFDAVTDFILKDENFIEKEISHESFAGIRDMVMRLETSNSLELQRVSRLVIRSLLDTTNKVVDEKTVTYDIEGSKTKLDVIEGAFLHDDLPSLAKKFLVFETLHPVGDFGVFINGRENKVSPTLAQVYESNPQMAYAVILRDLVKSGVESNSLELRKYLEGLQQGQGIMDRIGNGDVGFEELDSDEQNAVRRFVNQLVAGHNQTVKGREEVAAMLARGGVHSEDEIPEGANWLYYNMPITVDTVKRINAAFGTTKRYSVSDRLVRQFAYNNGYAGVDDMLVKMNAIRDVAEARNIEATSKPFVVRAGDIVKNVNGKYLDSLLGDGTNCKEFLGASADSDQTPLDTDFTLVEREASIADCHEIQNNPNGNYGHVWYVSHVTPERYSVTRKSDGHSGLAQSNPDVGDTRMELFETMHETHYGVRTGIGSTNIDALIIDQDYEHLDRTAFRVVKNGFYIPIYDRVTGNLIFTPEDYKALRTSLSGNHEYRTGEYQKASDADLTADTRYTSGVEINVDENNKEVAKKSSAILAAMADKLTGTGLEFRDHIDSDLTPGFIEVSNTGSTGRGTNVPGDGDFDYIFRVDRGIFKDTGRLNELSKRLFGAIIMDRNSEIRSGESEADIRTKHVHVDGLDDEVDIDVTFVQRTDKVTYATEDCISDYLSNFEGEERAQVVKNIIVAKKLFKEHGCYKPKHAGGTDEFGKSLAQGGLGGVGVENWILQNGGSLTAAARSFLTAAGVYDNPDAKPKPFEEFVKDYQIWDLGANHMAEERGDRYPHDNFVANNLDASGYEKIINALLAEGFGVS